MSAGRFAGYFASGSNHPGEIAGLAAIGMNVGVAAHHVAEAAMRELESVAGTGIKVFVDSGAFSEIGKDLVVKKEITAAEWDKRLGRYERLAKTFGSSLYCVAPDAVARQGKTLDRLVAYAWRMRKLRAMGANVIVPIQKGVRSMANFDKAVTEALGFDDYVRGIPLCKDATSLEELRAFAAELPAGTRVHLLGKGPYSKEWEAFAGAVSHCVVTCDSVRITALVGRTNGPGGGPRALTKAQDAARAKHGFPAAPTKLDREAVYVIKRDAIIEVMGPEVVEGRGRVGAAA